MNNEPVKQIALFGTSADPPTVGHQTILRWLSRHYDLVVVWASDNPFKQHHTSLDNRTEMLRLAIAEIDSERNNIDIYPELSDRYTLVTLNKARQIWGKQAEFTLVIGADVLKQINNWYRIEELLKEVRLLIVPRSGYSITESKLADLESKGGKYAIATLDAPQVSSSTYRLKEDQTVLPPAVENYILKENLYSSVPETSAREKEQV